MRNNFSEIGKMVGVVSDDVAKETINFVRKMLS